MLSDTIKSIAKTNAVLFLAFGDEINVEGLKELVFLQEHAELISKCCNRS